MAMEDVRSLKRKGIEIEPEEIVRLNALGVVAESNPTSSSFYSIPRCAFLSSGDDEDDILTFREPTIGHQLWMDRVFQAYDEDDETTRFMVTAYAITKDWNELPTWSNFSKLKKEIVRFLKSLSKYTLSQVSNCVMYCLNGNNANDQEYPEILPSVDKDDECLPNQQASSTIGVIHEAQALNLGIPLEDAKGMTKSELQSVLLRAYDYKGIKV